MRSLHCLAFVAALSASAGALADDVRFRLANGTSYPIRSIVLSPANLGAWGPNVLVPPSIKPGDAREVTVRGAFFSCNLDMKVVFDTIDDQPVWQYLDVCALKRIRLSFDQMSGVTTASYEE